MLIPTQHSDILDSALRVAVSASQDPRLAAMAINADIALLKSHINNGQMDKQDIRRAERTIGQMQREGRRYNYYYRPQSKNQQPPAAA